MEEPGWELICLGPNSAPLSGCGDGADGLELLLIMLPFLPFWWLVKCENPHAIVTLSIFKVFPMQNHVVYSYHRSLWIGCVSLSQHSRVTSSGEGGENMRTSCAAKTLAVARCVFAWLHTWNWKPWSPKGKHIWKASTNVHKSIMYILQFWSRWVDGFGSFPWLAACIQWYLECVYIVIYEYMIILYELWLCSVLVDSWRFQVTGTGAWNGESFQVTRSFQIFGYFDQIWQLIQAVISSGVVLLISGHFNLMVASLWEMNV